MMAATYFIEECNRRSTHAGHTYGILKLKGILWPDRLFIFLTAQRGCVPVAQTKGGFFSESAIHFSNLQISKKHYSKSLS